jgi:hypothetical protein
MKQSRIPVAYLLLVMYFLHDRRRMSIDTKVATLHYEYGSGNTHNDKRMRSWDS